MNPKDSPDVTPATLAELRNETDAVRLIAERLRMKEMGPADHIRTKHEIKAFVESGNAASAIELLKRAQARRELNQVASIQASQRQGQRMAD
jgi:hypothetical protein